MAKEYARRQATRESGGVFKSASLVLVAFFCGYLSASVFNLSQLTTWLNAQLAQTGSAPIAKPLQKQAVLPKPKFEFYTLLTKDKVPTVSVSQPTTPAVMPVAIAAVAATPKQASIAMPSPPHMDPVVSAIKNGFFVQVGSFRSRQEAERINASLRLKGYSVSLINATPQNGNWFRVVLGPYTNRELAKKAQIAVAQREHVMGMIRKMDA